VSVIQTVDYSSVSHPNRRLSKCQSTKSSIIQVSFIQTVDYPSISHPNRLISKCHSSKPSIIQVSVIQTVDYPNINQPSIIRKSIIQSLIILNTADKNVTVYCPFTVDYNEITLNRLKHYSISSSNVNYHMFVSLKLISQFTFFLSHLSYGYIQIEITNYAVWLCISFKIIIPFVE